MTVLEQLDVDDIDRSLSAFRDALKLHREAINALNVYPVPDGDTGTNMSLTLDSVVAELASAPADAAARWKAISHGSLMGARGNSGVILSQILRGLADTLGAAPAVTPQTLADAFSVAAEAAYGAVMKPVEGTILTVMGDVAAEAGHAADDDESLVRLLERCAREGKRSLDNTPELLPVLKDAGVVDAGGAGLLLLIDGLLHVVDGRDLPPAPDIQRAVAAVPTARPDVHATDRPDVSELRYEVMFFLCLLYTSDAADERVRV
mgnify:FL=1